MKELLDLLEKLDKIDRLVLPNGAKGAVWLADVIEVIIKNYRDNETIGSK